MIEQELFGVHNRPKYVFQRWPLVFRLVALGLHEFQRRGQFGSGGPAGIGAQLQFLHNFGGRLAGRQQFGDFPVAIGQFVFDFVGVGQ